MPNISPLFNGQTLFDANGQVLALGQIYTYQAGSTNPYPSFTNETGTVLQTNPIILGADGKLNNVLWLQENIAYKFIVQTASGLQVDIYDNISGVVTSLPTFELLPTGVILIWSGAVGSIPSGWQLCDGTNGVIDLRDKFVIGAGGNYPPSTIGGSTSYTPTGNVSVQGTGITETQMPRHWHRMVGPFGTTNVQGGEFGFGNYGGGTPDDTAFAYGTWSVGQGAPSGNSNVTGANAGDPHTHTATFDGVTSTIIPPYYALCFIQKL